jgi:hypothetical protein
MERAIHGFDLIHFILYIHLVKHSLFVKIEVPRSLPKIKVRNMRSVDNVITLIDVFCFPEILNFATNSRSFGVPEDESSSSILLLFLFSISSA